MIPENAYAPSAADRCRRRSPLHVAAMRPRPCRAYGGKIIGAGGGGFLLIVGPPEQRPAIDAAVGQLHRVPLRLEPDGCHVVYVNEK